MDSSLDRQVPLIGAEIGGYRVVDFVGRGATGAVYLAQDVSLGRFAALKVLPGAHADDSPAVRSFLWEAQIAAPLKHQNIVRIYAAGVQHGVPFIAMELVDGESMDHVLAREGRVPWETALAIAAQTAEALDCAHAQGVVHCDLKPGNLTLDRLGRVRLMDFGIAATVGAGRGMHAPGDQLGTLHYLAPEQCAGGELRPATDLFALGVVLYQMVAGRLPFDGDSTVNLMRSISADEPPRLNRIMPEVPDDVARLVACLLQKRPEDRPQDARTVSDTICRLLVQKTDRPAWRDGLASFIREQGQLAAFETISACEQSTPTSRSGEVSTGHDQPKPRIAIWAVAAAAAFLIATVAAFALFSYRPPSPVEAAVLDVCSFARGGPNLLKVGSPGQGFQVAQIAWIGDAPVLAAWIEGMEGARTHGAHGLVVLDPVRERALEAGSPVGPALTADYARCPFPRPAAFCLPMMPSNTPLHEAFLHVGLQEEGGNRHLVALAQFWQESSPRLEILYRQACAVPEEAAVAGADMPSGLRAVPKPDGFTICLILADASGAGDYLVERDLRWKPYERVSEPLARPGRPILPETMQYSPLGERVAYMREHEGVRELWVVASGGREVDGRLLAGGDLGSRAAFSPDGRHVAVEVDASAVEGSDIHVFNVADGSLTAQLGPGRLSNAPWHPSGAYVFVAQAEGEHAQMWAVEFSRPHRRVRIAEVPGRVESGWVISPGGEWAAVLVAQGEGREVAFVKLGPAPFGAPMPEPGRTS